MATPTAKQLGQAAIGTSVSTLYTVPGSTTTILKSFDICNTTPNTIHVRVHIVPNAGSQNTNNALLYDYSVFAKDSGIFGWEGEQVMAAGSTVQIQADATGLTITASGVELV